MNASKGRQAQGHGGPTAIRVGAAICVLTGMLSPGLSSPAAAQPLDSPYLVRDIANGPTNEAVDARIQPDAAAGGRVLLWASSLAAGSRWTLWSTDGTESGSIGISDLFSSSSAQSSPAGPLCSDGSKALYFDCNESTPERGLWTTDGTRAGTAMLSSLPSRSSVTMGRVASSCDELTVSGTTLFWTQQNQGLQPPTYDLWSTNASAEGTRLVTHLGRDVDVVGAGVPDWARLGDQLVFSLRTMPNGFELWRTDGTATGTVPFLSTLEGTQQLAARGFAVVGEAAFFAGSNGSAPAPLAVTDGTAPGTRVFPNLLVGPLYSWAPPLGVALAEKLVLAATSSGSSQLWGVSPDASEPQVLTALVEVESLVPLAEKPIGSRAVFVAKFQAPESEEFARLLLSDGTAEGTEVVEAVCAGTDFCRVDPLGVAGSAAYFKTVENTGVALWRTDGTTDGTVLVRSFDCEQSCELTPLGASGTKLYLILGGEDPPATWTLWVTDGSPSGTLEILAPGTADLSLSPYHAAIRLPEDRLLFVARDAEAGLEPWITDGTVAGSHRLMNLGSYVNESSPTHLERSGSRVLFAAGTLAAGVEPWLSDGTDSGTAMVIDARPGPSGSSAQPLDSAGGVWPLVLSSELAGSPNALYATTGEPGHLEWLGPSSGATFSIPFENSALIAAGTELLRFDADPPRVEWVAEINLGFFLPQFLSRGARGAYFRKHASGSEDLWITDGTQPGTRLLCEAPQYTGHDSSQWIGELGNGVVFRANAPDGLIRPYFCREGAEAVLLSGFLDATDNSNPDGFVAAGEWSLFAATDFSGDRELWRTNGTLAGTERLANLSPSDSSAPGDFAAVEGGVLFSADDGQHGRELWFSDGTASGTWMVADIAPGPMSSRPSGFEAIGGVQVFAAETLAEGRELWVTAGTAESTGPLPEIRPGPLSSWPEELTATQHRVFLRATDERGSELWALCPSWVPGTVQACNELFVDGFEIGSGDRWSVSAP